MADFPCWFLQPPATALFWLPAAEPIDYPSVIMPYTLINDLVPPQVVNVNPPVLTDLQAGSVLQFDIIETIGIATACIFAWFEKARRYEVVWDGDAFGPEYEEFSARTTLPSPLIGWHFLLTRKDGWPEPPKIRIHAVDKAGNISV